MSKKYHFWISGCQMNYADARQVANRLEHLDYRFTATAEEADVSVLQTCTVRQQSEDKALGRLSSLKSLKEARPDLTLAMMGCVVGVKGNAVLKERFPYVDVWMPPATDGAPLIAHLQQDDDQALEVAATDNWRLKGAYTWLTMELDLDGDSSDTFSEAQEDESPQHTISLRSLLSLGRQVELDLWLRYVDQLTGSDIDDYVTLDARLGYRPSSTLLVELVGRNLVEPSHPEFSPEIVATSPSEVERSVYGKISLSF